MYGLAIEGRCCYTLCLPPSPILVSILPSACQTAVLYPHCHEKKPQVLCFVQDPAQHSTARCQVFNLHSARALDLVALSLFDKALHVQNEILFSRSRALWRRENKNRKNRQKIKNLTGLVSTRYQIFQNIHDWFLRLTLPLISVLLTYTLTSTTINSMHLLFLLNLAICTLEMCWVRPNVSSEQPSTMQPHVSSLSCLSFAK